MTPLRTIVVPTDFSPAAEAALDCAADLAVQEGARLVVLHVCEPPWGANPARAVLPPDTTEALVASAARRLDRSLERVRRRCRASASVRVGEARQVIPTCAREVEAELIVMGTYGWHGGEHDRLGSLTRSVVHNGPCPVLTIRARHGGSRPQRPSQSIGDGTAPDCTDTTASA